MPDFIQWRNLCGKIERPGDVKLVHRRSVVQEHKKDDFRRF